MERRKFGPLGDVSVLTLGGGGIGQVYGKTDRSEGVRTLEEAVVAGVDFIDVAPTYGKGEAERVVGSAFAGRLPVGVRVATKCFVDGDPLATDVYDILMRSLSQSLDRMQLDCVDLFFLHGLHIPGKTSHPYKGTSRALFVDAVRPALERVVAEGYARSWGLTAVGFPSALIESIGERPRPAAIQAVTNLLDSPGNMAVFPEPERPRDIIATACEHGIGVMGIRVLGAGALARELDRELAAERPEVVDFERAAPFRALSAALGESPAELAIRYALAMTGVSTLILGAKNRQELRETLSAVSRGRLDEELMRRVDLVVRGRTWEERT